MVHNKYTSNIKNIEINKVISSCPTLDLNLFTEYLLCARPYDDRFIYVYNIEHVGL